MSGPWWVHLRTAGVADLQFKGRPEFARERVVNGLISREGLKVVLAAQQELQGLAGALEAEAGFVF
jgi:hypothetical protein